MKRSLMFAVQTTLLMFALGTVGAPASAQSARKDCEELKSEIAARIEANGVRHYQLQIVEPGATDVGRIVGSCNGGNAQIAYQRGSPPREPETEAAVAVAPVSDAGALHMGPPALLETLAQHEM